MKSLTTIKSHLLFAFGILFAMQANAQVKIGSNPTTITTKTHLEVEGINGKKVVVSDSGKVGIGTVSPAVALEVNSGTTGKSGFKLSQLTSTTPATSGSVALGVDALGNVVIVPTVTGSGTGAVTTPGVSQNTVNKDCLGYEPTGTAAAASASGLVPGTTTSYTKTGGTNTVTNPENNHIYVAYTLGNGVNWQDAFAFAKSLGGYLVTITTNTEWNFVKTTFLTTLQNNIWIGYNKVTDPGNPVQLTWITCERSRIVWGNTSTTETQWSNNEPNNAGGDEGCAHIWGAYSAATQYANRQWNDIDCTTTTYTPAFLSARKFDQLIIEFNQ